MTCNDGVGDDGDVDYLDTNKACNEKNGKGNDGHLGIDGWTVMWWSRWRWLTADNDDGDNDDDDDDDDDDNMTVYLAVFLKTLAPKRPLPSNSSHHKN